MSLGFRDPGGRLVIVGQRVLRVMTDEMVAATVSDVLALDLVKGAVQDGRLIRSRRLAPEEIPAALLATESAPAPLVLEHERVPFPSYPYEWPPEMLIEAGRLTLDLARELLARGFGLKDATPYNVLYRGTAPVFVDILSIERRDLLDPTWRAYAQFIRTFVSPLLANRAFGLRLDALLLTRRDGLEPEELYRLAGPLRRLLPPFLILASLPTWLARAKKANPDPVYAPRLLRNQEQARFILGSILDGLRRRLNRLESQRGAPSHWSVYEEDSQYTARDREAKSAFVQVALVEHKPPEVLDLGCNTGRFSLLAARAGARVVAVDSDPAVVGELWRRARKERLEILPLVVDISRPSPALGWRYAEHASFLERVRGSFDLVLMLALVHHLTVAEGVPLSEVAALAAELTRDLVVVEHVDPSDRQFHRLARGRDALFAGLGRGAFEDAFATHFETIRVERLSDAPRSLHLLRLRRAPRR